MSSQLNMTNRRVLLTSRPKGVPEADHFTVDESAVPEVGDGEFLRLFRLGRFKLPL